MRASLLFYPAAVLVLLTSPVWYSIGSNELRAQRFLRAFASTKLPDSAAVVKRHAYVANTGNSDGCDFIAEFTVAYDGSIDSLTAALTEPLSSYSSEIYQGPLKFTEGYGAKAIPGGPELYLRNAAGADKRFDVKVVEYARLLSFDFRCW